MMYELLQERYKPSLVRHPFFKHYAALDADAMKQICQAAISQIHFSSGDVVFSSGTPSENMFFVIRGECRYAPYKKTKHSKSDIQYERSTSSLSGPVIRD